ncbi:MAG: tetratricopeptide repeat protein [Oceanicola sp.]|nr:tetratricopeptide repeat protein [Oceanicola sp.]
MMRTTFLAAACFAMASPVFAAGSDSFTPPKPTPTAECPKGQIWDTETEACIDARDSRFEDADRIKAARELAYLDRPEDTLLILETLVRGDGDMALTYKGFAHRKAGRFEQGMAFYEAALARNPDNVLARSYMGQALAEVGDLDGAKAQLQLVTALAGRESWPAFALRLAIREGRSPAY